MEKIKIKYNEENINNIVFKNKDDKKLKKETQDNKLIDIRDINENKEIYEAQNQKIQKKNIINSKFEDKNKEINTLYNLFGTKDDLKNNVEKEVENEDESEDEDEDEDVKKVDENYDKAKNKITKNSNEIYSTYSKQIFGYFRKTKNRQ